MDRGFVYQYQDSIAQVGNRPSVIYFNDIYLTDADTLNQHSNEGMNKL